ncbi:MAG: hypothetical protein Q4D41_11100, partial [Prevotellaceae bacterium]|nr:hypothetical protein [Prevotellaceae bacterium]
GSKMITYAVISDKCIGNWQKPMLFSVKSAYFFSRKHAVSYPKTCQLWHVIACFIRLFYAHQEG